MQTLKDARPKLLLVDDEPTNLQVLRHILRDDYRLLFAKDGATALALANSEQPALILLDIMMPDMTGYDVCKTLKQSAATRDIPVIFVTALADMHDEAEAFEVGGVDYLTKPVSPLVVKARVRTHLSLVTVDELRQSRLLIVQRLGLAAEYKDNETGLHVIRMSHYAQVLGRAAGLTEREAEDLLHAAPMHDVGKIGIPDAILKKPGKLDPDEWEVMKQHASIGAHIMGEHKSGVLKMAHTIAQNHHEKWDGSGYPAGLRGEHIPLVARIVAVVDVFDALCSERPYKRAWPLEDVLALLRRDSGRHFDPTLVALFINELPAILDIQAKWAETPVQALPSPTPTLVDTHVQHST
jgi:putative two-component system response regulator